MPTRAARGCSHLRIPLPAGIAFVLWAAGAYPLAAGGLLASGDGSGTNNPLLLTSMSPDCDCGRPGSPYEWDAPFFDLDWSLALRGAYVRDGAGERFEALIIPSVTLTHETMRGGYELSAGAEVIRSSLDDYRLAALRASISGGRQFDALTDLTGRLDLSLTQDSPGDPGVPTDEALAPLIASVEAEAAVTRELGLFDATLRGTAARTVYGTTTLNDGTVLDNSTQDNWTASAGLRVGYAVTPIVTAFVDGSAGYQLYDQVSPIYLVALDAADYELRTGVSASWTSVLEAEASIGVGLRRFAEPSFADVVSTLYDASLTFRPDETLTLEANLSTSVGAPGPDSGGAARVEYAAAADARYRVNTWLAWRASAGWSYAALAGTTDAESEYDVGTGLDYLFNEFTTLTADYAYNWAGDNVDPAGEVEHRVTLGVTFSKPGDTRTLQ